LGLSLVFPFIFLLSMAKDEGWANIANSKMYFNIYFVAFMIPTILMVIGYSEKYKAAWIYKFLPFTEAKDIFKGTLKAFVINLLLPMYVFESIIFMIIFKGKIALDLVIVFLNIILFIVICFKCMKKTLPFSEPFEVVSQSQGFIVIPLFLIIGVLAGVHYGATKIDYGRYIYILILVIANIFAWEKAFNISIENM